MVRLTAHISEMYRLSADIKPVSRISADISLPTIIREGELPAYDGETEFVPTWDDQTIATKDKLLRSDISVLSIQSYEVSNDAGGITLSI